MSRDNVDRFLDAVEKMMDAQDDMWHEEQHCNYREQDRIREQVYEPARKDARFFFRQAIREVVKES